MNILIAGASGFGLRWQESLAPAITPVRVKTIFSPATVTFEWMKIPEPAQQLKKGR